MSNSFYNPSGAPITSSQGLSATMRTEFSSVAAGFALLPTLAGFGNKALVVNAGGTAVTVTTGSLALAGNFTTTGVFNLSLTLGASVTLTLPLVNGTLATLAGTETFTNKTITAAVLSGSFTGTYTLAGTPTITSPTISNPTLSGTVSGTYTLGGTPTLSAAVLTGTFTGTYTLAGTPSLTSPTIATGTVTADPTTNLGIASKQYVDNSYSQSQNPIINASMDVWQRGVTFVNPADFDFSADRYSYNFVGAGLVTIRQSTNVPTVAQASVLFNFSLEVDVTTADAAIAATDFYNIQHAVEGPNWRQFAQTIFTLSFWVRDTITGEHAVAFQNGFPDRSYVGTYTISVTDTWEYKTITVAASPVGGTWIYTVGGVGMVIIFTLAAGTDFHVAAGSWQTGNFYATATTVNSMSNAANFFRVTGLKVEIGIISTPLHPKTFNEELQNCERYFQKSFPYNTKPAQNAGVAGSELYVSPVTAATGLGMSVSLTTRMVNAGNVITYNPSAANAEVRNSTDAADDSGITTTSTEHSLGIAFTANAGNTAGDLHRVHWTLEAEL